MFLVERFLEPFPKILSAKLCRMNLNVLADQFMTLSQ